MAVILYKFILKIHFTLSALSMDQDFVKQLELEELEKKKKENADVPDPYTYTDPNDGSVYEWNAEKQAWFPKVKKKKEKMLFILNFLF